VAFRFHGVDFLGIDSLLSEEERAVRATARAFVDDQLLPIIEQCNRDARFPGELVLPMGSLGFYGSTLEGYGCAGMNNVEYGLLMQELERGDSAVRSFVSVQSALAMYAIYAFGSDEQKAAWLPGMATGQKLGCFGLTEPGFGSNPGGMRTRARRDADSYILSGEKMWITSGSIADAAIIWAKLDEPGASDPPIAGFLVETERPGFSAHDIHGKWSMRASVTSGLLLVDVRVPASALLPRADGLKSALQCLNQARYGIGWGAIGAAMSCYDTALQYAKQRTQFRDQPIASHQLIQQKLVWMVTEITKAQLLGVHCARLKDQGKLEPAHISMLKRNNVAMALDCARTSRDLLGANGITDEYPIMRHMCNLETVKTYEGTDHIHALVIGERVTGIAAYK